MAKTTTPKFGLPQWGLPTDTVLRSDFNTAFANVESFAVKETRGPLASRPAFGNPGAYYLDTASGIRYRDTGTAWVPEAVSASAISGVIPVQNIPNINADRVVGGVFQEGQIPPLSASKVAYGTLSLSVIPALDTSRITSGVFPVARIPDLNASKVTAGEFATARIPDLSASKITSGVLATSRIPNLDASSVNTGVFFASQIPALDASKVTSGSFSSDRIPSLDASKIGTGTLSSDRIPGLDASKIGSGTFSSDRIPTINQSKVAGTWNKEVSTSSVVTGGAIAASNAGYGSWFAGAVAMYQTLGVNSTVTSGAGFVSGNSVLNSTTLALPNINSVTSGANVYISGGGYLNRSTSRRDAKLAIEDVPEDWAEKFWNLRPRTWFDRSDAERVAEGLTKEENGEEVDWSEIHADHLARIPGFVAEEVEEAGFEEFVTRDDNGEILGLSYDRMLTAAVVAMKEERLRVDELTRTVEEQGALIEELRQMIADLGKEPTE